MSGKNTRAETSHSRGDQGDNQTPDVSHIQNPDVTHEHNDINVRGTMTFVIALAIGIVVSFLLMWGMFGYLNGREAGLDAEQPASTLARGRKPEDRLPPEPRLQLAPGSQRHPLKEMDDVRNEWRTHLDNYAWMDQTTGTVRIPIERAKELLLQKGLPVREQPQVVGNPAEATRQLEDQRGIERTPTSQSSGQKTDTRLH